MSLIEGLLLEDDENVELWYMMGVAALSKDPADVESARFHLDHAKQMLDELIVQFQATGGPVEVYITICSAYVCTFTKNNIVLYMYMQAFPFADQYCLLEEHLRILVEKEKLLPAPAAGDAMDDDAGMIVEDLEEEEEWSSCDEDDN